MQTKIAKRLDGNAVGGGDGMMSDAIDGVSGKSRKKHVAKPASRPAGLKAKCTIHLSIEASQRLDIHATMMGLDRSTLVEKLINDHLRRYVVSDRGGSDSTSGDAVA